MALRTVKSKASAATIFGIVALLIGVVACGSDPVAATPAPTAAATSVPSATAPPPTSVPTATPTPPQPFDDCGPVGAATPRPDLERLYPAPNLILVSVKYYPAFLRAQLELQIEDIGDHTVNCRRFEIEPGDAQTQLLTEVPLRPFFDVPGSYCIRSYSGNESGISDYSEHVCVDIETPPAEECSINPSFGENTICELAVESVLVNRS